MSTSITQNTQMASLIVRPVEEFEKERWRRLMDEHHYLGSVPPIGESISYVAEVNGQWVALVGWSAGALKLAVRDAWIGWTGLGKSRRLNHIANNTRFLILPNPSICNLASQVLAANTRRISRDWQARYRHPIYLAETFVDTTRFRGTCYLAAGWQALGATKGYRRDRTKGYVQHGAPKQVFVKPLHPKARTRLAYPSSSGDFQWKDADLFSNGQIELDGKDGLVTVMRRVPDPRTRAGRRHSLVSVLAIAMGAMLSGATTFDAIAQWGKSLTRAQRKKLRSRTGEAPSTSTIRRVLISIDAEIFDAEVGAWLMRHGTVRDAIAIDGKTLRGSRDGETKPVHLLSALLHREGIVIAQRRIGDKTNEIPEAKRMMAGMDIEGRCVTLDALHCQKGTANFIVEEKKADFLLTVKDNQPTLVAAMQSLDYGDISP